MNKNAVSMKHDLEKIIQPGHQICAYESSTSSTTAG